MTDQAINYRKKCDMAQNNRRWNRGQNQDKTKKKDDSYIENFINQKGTYICSSEL